MKKLLLMTGLVMVLTACSTSSSTLPKPSTPSNQLQTERLIGNWAFTYSILSTFTNKYSLSRVEKSTLSNSLDDYFIIGEDSFATTIVARYNSKLGKFTLLDSSPILDEFFVFDFTDATHVSGCAYLSSGTTESDCYPMKGVRTSATAGPLGFSVQRSALAEVTPGWAKDPNIAALRQMLKAQIK